MTRNEALFSIRSIIEELSGPYQIISKVERARMAEQLEKAADVLDAEPVPVIVNASHTCAVTKSDVERLRFHSKITRGMPGMHNKNLWSTEMAERFEKHLNGGHDA